MTKLFGLLTDADLMHDIETAQETLLKEANAILKNHEKTKAFNGGVILKNLNDLGFKNSTSIKEFKSKLQLDRDNYELKSVIEYYMCTYPNNKFINDDIVGKICKKYKLVLGPVSRYIGSIPVKNQAEIVNFKFRSTDFRADKTAYTDEIKNVIARGFASDEERNTNRFIAEMEQSVRRVKHVDNSITSSYDLIQQSTIIGGTGLVIIAPKKKFDLKGMEVKGHSLFNIKPIFLTDPIVMQPVKDGFLIISAWGDEASDPLVVNSKHN